MSGYKQVRPLEGMGAPLKVRHELRQLFERWLSRSRHPRLIVGSDGMVDELGLLDLCKHYRLEYPGSAEDIAKTWDESEQRIAEGGPTFDDLVRMGWVFFDGGRWIMQSAPIGTSAHITFPSPSTKTFLEELSKVRLVAKEDTPPPSTRALAARIAPEEWLDEHIPTRNPEWVAGRLWERLCPQPLVGAGDGSNRTEVAAAEGGARVLPQALEAHERDVDRAFLEWSAWCNAVGCAGRWDIGWGPTQMQYCREAAHRVLERQALWGNWDNDAASYADVLEKTFAIPPDRLRFSRIPRTAPPRTLVSGVDWLASLEVEHLMMERLISPSTVSFALNLLCSELDTTGIGPRVSAEAETVLSFAAAHPMALQQILFRVKAVPALLVDMLLHPLIACLAARLVIEWHQEGERGNDRILSREAQTKAFAVQDALSLLAYHLNKNTLDLEECAALVTWCYGDDSGRGRAAADARRPIGRQILGMVAGEKEEVQTAVLQHLVDQAAYENNVPRAQFAGVLDGLGCLPSARRTNAFAIVALYTKFARDLHLDWTDASSLSAELAARLIATAFVQAAPERDALLIPLDSAELLRQAPEEEELSLRSTIAHTLREHVRLLARAVAGWPDGAVPTELADAFQALVSRSAIEHAEKGRVGALTDRYSPNRFLAREEGSPAQDLAAAWRGLDGTHQDAMLQALAQSDDPVLLAELCQYLPAAAKTGIQARLRQLKPGEASTLWTWPELQHRIECLLAAGEYGLAREHLDETAQDLERAPPQFRLGLFGLGLQLLLKEKNWAALDGATVPSTLDVSTTRQAQDQLDFYTATSQLLRPNGNLAGARTVLQGLAARPGAASAYKENVFAIAIQQLLGPTLHPLTGEDKVTGESLLGEINAAVDADEKLASSSLLANRALLLLALQRPDEALESMAARRREMPSLELELVAVLAKTEMGSRGDAMAILDAAITEFGPDERLVAAKEDLQAGVAASSVASASVAVDTISSIRAALQQLTELPVSQVGDVLGPPGGGLQGYLVRQISRAVAALQQMSAMLRDKKNPEDEARFEDDLNTAVRKVLGASLAVAKWNVADQSPGGATDNGNPGRRDAVIEAFGQEICIYEALVCSGLERTKTKAHFDKLFSYGHCEIYFLVTYSYAKALEPLLDYARKMLEHEVPSGLTYISCASLGPDCETSGYVATYRAGHREVAVVFLIADLRVRGRG
ncbi:MAG: hypothetical protein KGL42_01435 [Betaproteobacteria bacterium]|nr:hypothetical protein [Betaproteobacteria bacterium]